MVFSVLKVETLHVKKQNYNSFMKKLMQFPKKLVAIFLGSTVLLITTILLTLTVCKLSVPYTVVKYEKVYLSINCYC